MGLAHDELHLRQVTRADAPLLLAWRNDPATREASRQTALVAKHEHEAWLAGVLASAERVIRIAECAGRPVGVVRADRLCQGWELSWTVAPAARGQGIGRRMLTMFAATLEGPLVATMRRGHVASAKMAAAAGFTLGDRELTVLTDDQLISVIIRRDRRRHITAFEG